MRLSLWVSSVNKSSVWGPYIISWHYWVRTCSLMADQKHTECYLPPIGNAAFGKACLFRVVGSAARVGVGDPVCDLVESSVFPIIVWSLQAFKSPSAKWELLTSSGLRGTWEKYMESPQNTVDTLNSRPFSLSKICSGKLSSSQVYFQRALKKGT